VGELVECEARFGGSRWERGWPETMGELVGAEQKHRAGAVGELAKRCMCELRWRHGQGHRRPATMGDLVSAWRSSKLGAAGDKVDFARPVIAAVENGRR